MLLKEMVSERKESNVKQFNRNVRRGDIYWYDLTDMGNHTQRGLHPVLVVSNNLANKHSSVISVVGISSQLWKCKLPTHVLIQNNETNGLDRPSFIQTEQIFPVDKNKLGGYIGYIVNDEIDRAIEISLGLRKVTSEKEDILNNKIKHLKELDFIIASLLDKCHNQIIDATQQFINERSDLYLDIKSFCNENNIRLEYYYTNDKRFELAI